MTNCSGTNALTNIVQCNGLGGKGGMCKDKIGVKMGKGDWEGQREQTKQDIFVISNMLLDQTCHTVHTQPNCSILPNIHPPSELGLGVKVATVLVLIKPCGFILTTVSNG